MKYIKLIIFFITFFSCKESLDKTQRIEVNYNIVYSDLESIMPGDLRIFEKYILWTDPISVEDFIHIIDLKTGKEVHKFIQTGEGPNEFVTPSLGDALNNQTLIYDMNRDKLVILSLDSLFQKESTRFIFNTNTMNAARVLALENNNILRFFPEKLNQFEWNDQKFGNIPFKEKAENLYNIMQGHLFYNSEKESLVYANIYFPYIALYKKDINNKFKFTWEKKGDFKYQYYNNEIKLDRTKKGIKELALSADYIITLQRDYKNDPIDESTVGRNFNKNPTTVFVYNYEGELIKIVDIKIPILRIAASEKNNTVYAIVTNPDFEIIKFDLN